MPIKDRDEVINEIMSALEEHTPFTNTAPESRVGLIVNILGTEIGKAHEALQEVERRASLSQSYDQYLNRFGELMGLQRLPGESDENYRYRISTRLDSAFAGKREAIRMKALESPLVKTVHLRPFTHGGGSFSLYVIPHAYHQINEAVGHVRELVSDLLVDGIRETITGPRVLAVSMDVVVAFKGFRQSDPAAAEIRRNVQQAIKAYVDGLDMGQSIIIAQLVHEALQAHPSIADVQVRRLQIGDRPLLVRNVVPYWDEKFYVLHTADINVL